MLFVFGWREAAEGGVSTAPVVVRQPPTQARARGVATGYSARDQACRSPGPDHPGDQQAMGAVITPFSGPGGASSNSSGGRGIDVISVRGRSPTSTPPSAIRRPRLGTAHGRLATPRVTSPRSGWSGGTNGRNSTRRAKATNRQSRSECALFTPQELQIVQLAAEDPTRLGITSHSESHMKHSGH